MRDRSSAESFFARAFPPFDAPSIPNATAMGFFFLAVFVMSVRYAKIIRE